jgi:RecA/RadA recombinase
MPIDNISFGEDPLETVEDFFEDLEDVATKAKGPTLYILDSLDALSDRGELERDMDKGSYGAEKAKKLSQMFRRLVRKLTNKKVTVIIVSQVRDKIGAMFGRKTTRSGGKALDFYASQVVYLAHLGTLHRMIRGQKRVTAVKVKAKLDKNKISLPFREADFTIKFGYGVDDAQACIDWLHQTKRLKGAGVSPEDKKAYLEVLLEMTPAAAQRKLESLQTLVKNNWIEIEDEVMPVRRKYEAA